ncbi:fasciclin domain-containing protein [Fontibacter flavus]|uniref:Fasciclin domain-containing protein n=1 Tax=Fontibacter flavus TaxID=654838 RepID=A0ABV6FSF2_9BACT
MKKIFSIAMLVTFFVTSAFTANKNSTIYAENDIVDLAVQTDFLSTLVAAVQAGELVDVLKGDGPFTVFAPTNEAFANLPAGTVEELLKPENKSKLVAVLTYHVVPGKVYSNDLKDGMKAKTAQGAEVTISLKGGKAMVNNANVTTADIEASNGVVHVIDTVILPPM